MASQTQTQTQTQRSEPGSELELEDDDVEKLEEDVNQMAQKILDYRSTLPDQLKNALASALVAQRPVAPANLGDGSQPEPSVNPNQDQERPSESGKEVILGEEDQETARKAELVKRKISSNSSAMPNLLKRVKECISRIENLQSRNGFIHPAFKRRRQVDPATLLSLDSENL